VRRLTPLLVAGRTKSIRSSWNSLPPLRLRLPKKLVINKGKHNIIVRLSWLWLDIVLIYLELRT
jgi:hypothetical protein